MSFIYEREARGSMDDVGARLEKAAKDRKFGVIGVVDLQARMKDKGVDFAKPCRIYEVCNPQKARDVLEADMHVSTALPCRISLYAEGDRIRLATLLPTATLRLFGKPGLEAVAEEVERDIKAMMDEAAGHG